MSNQAYYFDAFISYRHNDRDKAIADKLQKLAEQYRSPCDGEYIKKGQRIQRIFTDRSELPMSADLGAAIHTALEKSRFLLVIACPEYMQSKWCMEELKTFLRLNQNSTERILFIHSGGSPSCITDILRAAGVCVDTDSFSEPIYINACKPTVQESLKVIRSEYLRLAAVLIGCSFDDLYQRHKNARTRRLLIAVSTILVSVMIVGSLLISQRYQLALREQEVAYEQQLRQQEVAYQQQLRQQETDYYEMNTAISDILNYVQNKNRLAALDEMVDLYSKYGHKQSYADYLEQQLNTVAVSASYAPAFSAFANISAPFESTQLWTSSDGKYVIAADAPSARLEGTLHIVLFDMFLRELSTHDLPVADWLSQIYPMDTMQVDYQEAESTFELILNANKDLSKRLVFSAAGELLHDDTITVENPIQPTKKIQELYAYLSSEFSNPLCMGSDRVYAVINEDDSDFEVFGDSDETMMVVSAADEVEYIASFTRASRVHALDSISITEDERFVLVKETQGIYNDVLTVCDTMSKWDSVTIDMGNHRIESMTYRFDEKKQTGLFLFHLSIPGVNEYSLIAQCQVAYGKLQHCEMYKTKSLAYQCLLNAQGYVYIMEGSDITILSTRNICLADALAGIDPVSSISTDFKQNDLIKDPNSFTATGTSGLQPVNTESLIIDGNLGRSHFFAPEFYSGANIGISISDSKGNSLVEFYNIAGYDNGGTKLGYFNERDGIFGLIDYESSDNFEAFRLYDFYSLMELLS